MVKFYSTFILALCLGVCLTAQTSFSDDFESYDVGARLAQSSPDWNTWSNAPGSTEDVVITDAQALSGTKSIRLVGSASGGPNDMVLPFKNKYTTGTFSLSFNVFVVEGGGGAYWNFQGEQTVNQVFSHNTFIQPDGTVQFTDGNNALVAQSRVVLGQWNQIDYEINLTDNSWKVSVNGNCAGAFANVSNAVASLNLYPTANTDFFVDDVSFDWTDEVQSYGYDVSVEADETSIGGLVGMTEALAGTITNRGLENITEVELSVEYPDGPQTFTYDGLDLATGESIAFDLEQDYELSEGDNNLVIEVKSINGGQPDEESCNSYVSRTLLGVVPAEGKGVVVEEGTGTWCGWCPRGEVFMNRLSAKYPDHFIGVAVHNGDPMAVSGYDGQHGFAGYPAATVNRKSSDTGFGVISDLEGPFLQYIGEEARATMEVGAVMEDGPGLVRFSIEVTANVPLNRLYRLALILTEDDLTGTSPAWAQANFYAGGGQGPMGGYENRPNPVPAFDMEYDHVGRAVPLGFSGDNNAFADGLMPGESIILEYAYAIPDSWDMDKMHVIAALIDVSRNIDNATSVTMEEALDRGLITSTTEIEYLSDVAVSPNPVQDELTVIMRSTQDTEMLVSLTDMMGRAISAESIIVQAGYNTYQRDVNGLQSGAYMVVMESADGMETVKFIKQ